MIPLDDDTPRVSATDDAPAFQPLDRTYDQLVEHSMRIFLNSYAEQAAESLEEDGIHGTLGVISTDRLGDYLRDACELSETALPEEENLVTALIMAQSISLLCATTTLDLAMESFMKGDGVLSAGSLFINDPVVIQALNGYEMPDGEVILVPSADFYTTDQMPGDDRRDLLMGAIRWKGHYLCRPALVSLPDIEDALTSADNYGVVAKTANVSYLPRYGTH